MAEKFSHNVVNGSESASASALADVASNHINATSALSGPSTSFENAQNTLRKPSQPDQSISPSLDKVAVNDATDPSAGVAAKLTAKHDVHDRPIIANGSDAGHLTNRGDEVDHLGVNVAADDVSIPDHSVDHSVNSDTDIGRVDGSDAVREGAEILKTNLVKKPATFSKVSVTKTFLAKSATPQPTQNKLGDKPSTSSTSTPLLAKPRLVAKTVGSLQNAQKASLGANGGSGPDASKVWNKNRPVVPTPPSKLTDEQLKQQYGIHLATRLQTNENGKDNTWADIDDDDEDWAPETVVWVDGTKSTLTPADTPALPVVPPKTTSPTPVAKAADAVKPTLVAKRATDLGLSKTILKPGIAAQQARQQGVGSATGEKPILKAKSPAPAPTKSPWAPIPAIEAVSPINPPVQHDHGPTPVAQPLPPQDARAYEPSLAPQPAREIAADTFERSSLGIRPEGASRELFNSANGRYEPVPESRGPVRSERKTAVLQRPSQNNINAVESPSLVRNGSQASGPWARRRESSHSQNSNPAARRISVSKSVDSSQHAEVNDGTVEGGAAAQSSHSVSFSKQSPWNAQLAPRPEQSEPDQVAEDPVKVQERVMREKREMAIRRRKEQEEKEEAERTERLRAKLSALAGAGKSRKEREAEAAEKKTSETVVPAKTAPSQTSTSVVPAPDDSKSATDLKAETSQPEAAAHVPSTSEKEDPSPLPAKVHQVNLTERASVPPPADAQQAQQSVSRSNVSPAATSRSNFVQPQSSYKPTSSAYPSPGDRKSQPFGRSPLTNNDAFSSWGNAPSSGNIWGSSGMGNGTFETASAFAPLPMQNSSTLPPPLGMSMPAGPRISPESQAQEGRTTGLQSSQPSEPLRNFPNSSIETRSENNWASGRATATTQAAGASRPPHGPGPIAPPSRAQQQQVPAGAAPPRAGGVAAWNSAARSLPYQYSSDAKVGERRDAEPSPPPQTTIKETFKRTVRDSNAVLGAPRRYESTEFSVHEPHAQKTVTSNSPAPPSAQTQPTGPFTASTVLDDVGKSHATLAPIGPPNRAVLATSSVNVNFPTAPLPAILPVKEQSQPPPETSSHPVNNDVSIRPKVKLPPPPAIVKLPPAPLQPISSAVVQQRPINAWVHHGAARPIAQTADWQARFNGLFGRTPIHTEVPPSPPGTPPKDLATALPITSSSKVFFDEVAKLPAATVALPPFRNSDPSGAPERVTELRIFSKLPIEPSFNDELSFGSLPRVQLPKNIRYAANITSESGYNLLRTIPAWKVSKPTQPQSISAELYFYKAPPGYYLRIPGTKLNNVLVKHLHNPSETASTFERKHSTKFSKPRSRESAPKSAKGASDSQTQAKSSRAPSSAPSPSPAAGHDGSKRKSTATRSHKPRAQVTKA